MQKESLKAQAYKIIKAKILTCEYAPGAILTEERLREDIGASQTPIRYAVTRLEQERLMQILPQRGLMVTNITIAEIGHVFETRLLFEPYVLRQHGHLLSEDELLHQHALFQALQTGKAKEIYDHDDAFHALILRGVENPYLRGLYEQTHSQSLRIRMMAGYDMNERLVESCKEHMRIIDLALRKDWVQAAEEMRQHLISAREATFNLVRYGCFTI